MRVVCCLLFDVTSPFSSISFSLLLHYFIPSTLVSTHTLIGGAESPFDFLKRKKIVNKRTSKKFAKKLADCSLGQLSSKSALHHRPIQGYLIGSLVHLSVYLFPNKEETTSRLNRPYRYNQLIV